MTSHKSARKQQIEVITRGERRRRWSMEQKLEIVAESLEPGMSPIAVARRHGIGSGQLYTWRRQVREGQSGGECHLPVQFARVAVPTGSGHPELVPLHCDFDWLQPRQVGGIDQYLGAASDPFLAWPRSSASSIW